MPGAAGLSSGADLVRRSRLVALGWALAAGCIVPAKVVVIDAGEGGIVGDAAHDAAYEAGLRLCGAACVAATSVVACGPTCMSCPAPTNGQPTCDGTTCGVACNEGFMPDGASCVAIGPVTTTGRAFGFSLD